MKKIQNVKYKTLYLPGSITGGSVDEELEARMEIGLVNFLYLYSTKTKSHASGAIRAAVGTRNLSMSFIPAGDIPLGVKKPVSGVLAYWDYDRKAWRSCRRDRIVSIGKSIVTEEV